MNIRCIAACLVGASVLALNCAPARAQDVGPMMCSLAASMVTHSEYDWNRLLTVMLDGIRATDREPLP